MKEQNNPMTMNLDNGTELCYYEAGNGSRVILFVHGWGINASYWKKQMCYFSENYCVCAIDLPGFGQSIAKRNNFSLLAYANDIALFMELKGFAEVIVICHCMAGNIFLQAPLMFNPTITAIVGIDVFKMIDVEIFGETQKQMESFFGLLQFDYKTFASIFADKWMFHPHTPIEIKNKVKSDISNTNPDCGLTSFIDSMSFANASNCLELLPHKLFLINCDYLTTNESGLKKHCKQGVCVQYIENAGHFPMIEKPEVLNKLLEKALIQILSEVG